MLGRPARSVLGKACHLVLNGRDVNGNIYCHRNCAVADQARRQNAADPVQSFPLSVETGSGEKKWINVSMFVIPSYHPALSTVVHVLRPEPSRPSSLEKDLGERAVAPGEQLWPMTTREGQPIDLSKREKEILRFLSEGLPTAAIAKRLFIAPVTVRNHIQSILQKLDVHTKTLDQVELAKLEAATFYEERLLFLLTRLRNPRAHVVYVTSQPIHPLVLEYHFQFLAGIPPAMPALA